MHYYTIHPIAMKLWEVVEYTPAKVSDLVELPPALQRGDWEAKCVFYIASFIGIIGANIIIIMILNARAPLIIKLRFLE